MKARVVITFLTSARSVSRCQRSASIGPSTAADMTLNSVNVASRSDRRRAWPSEVAPIDTSPIGASFQKMGASASALRPDSIVARSKSSRGTLPVHMSSHNPNSACSLSSRL